MILRTDRTLLVPWEEKYAERLYELAKDDRIGPVAGWQVHRDVDNSREVIRNILAKEGTFAVVRRDVGVNVAGDASEVVGDNSILTGASEVAGDNSILTDARAEYIINTDNIIGSAGIVFGEDSSLNLPMWQGEIGYWLGYDYWGQGIMTEIVKELIRFGFEDIGLNTIWCGYFEGNEGSKRVQDKCGFTYHHTEEDMYWALLDKNVTEHVMYMTREMWEK